MIYWVRSGDAGPVKVGYAVTVSRRIALLQTGNPSPLVVLRTAAGERAVEGALHRLYRPKRVRAEWFLLDAEDVSVDLGTLTLPERNPLPASSAYSAAHLENLAQERGLTAMQLCRRAGISYSTFSRWRSGVTMPTMRVLSRLHGALSA